LWRPPRLQFLDVAPFALDGALQPGDRVALDLAGPLDLISGCWPAGLSFDLLAAVAHPNRVAADTRVVEAEQCAGELLKLLFAQALIQIAPRIARLLSRSGAPAKPAAAVDQSRQVSRRSAAARSVTLTDHLDSIMSDPYTHSYRHLRNRSVALRRADSRQCEGRSRIERANWTFPGVPGRVDIRLHQHQIVAIPSIGIRIRHVKDGTVQGSETAGGSSSCRQLSRVGARPR
jgi:hypothetical protein